MGCYLNLAVVLKHLHPRVCSMCMHVHVCACVCACVCGVCVSTTDTETLSHPPTIHQPPGGGPPG